MRDVAATIAVFAGRGTYASSHLSGTIEVALDTLPLPRSNASMNPYEMPGAASLHNASRSSENAGGSSASRSSEVLSIELQGNSSLLSVLGLEMLPHASNLMLFTASDDYRDSVAPDTQPPLPAAHTYAGAAVEWQTDEDEACALYATCNLGVGRRGRALAAVTLKDADSFVHYQHGASPFARAPSDNDVRLNALLPRMPNVPAVSSQGCNAEMVKQGVYDGHTLMLHALDRNVLQPTLLHTTPFAGPGVTGDDVAKALDGNLSSGVSIDGGGYLGLDLGHVYRASTVRVVLCNTEVSRAPQNQLQRASHAMRRARIEGSNVSSTSGFVHLAALLPLQASLYIAHGVYLSTPLPAHTHGIRWMRIMLDPLHPLDPHHPATQPTAFQANTHAPLCLAEVEVHTGEIRQGLSQVEPGSCSYHLNLDVLYQVLPHLPQLPHPC